LCISSALIVVYFFCVCLSNLVFLKCSGSEAHRLKKLIQSSFLMCAVNFLDIKFVKLALNGLLFFLGPLWENWRPNQGPFLRLRG
jgi:hypothetical protein